MPPVQSTAAHFLLVNTKGGFQTCGFILVLTQKCPSKVSLCQWQLNHHCWGSVCTCRKQIDRCCLHEDDISGQQLCDISIHLLGRLHLRSTPFCSLPTGPFKYLICKPHTYKGYLLQVFNASFSRALWIQKQHFVLQSSPILKGHTYKSCMRSACHISTHARDVNSVPGTVTEVTGACTHLLYVFTHLNTRAVLQSANPDRHSNIETRLYNGYLQALSLKQQNPH